MTQEQQEDQLSPGGRKLLVRGAQQLGFPLSAEQVDHFSRLQALLIGAGRTTNLTALKDERDIVLKHFLDSLSCLTGGQFEGEGLSVLDIGTGAGFPGLPLALLRPGLHFTLLDSTRKKIAFVQRAADALRLGHVTPLVGRAEALGQDPTQRARHDRVVIRAVSSLPVLAELALPLLKVGGVLVAQKGDVGEAELEQGERAARLLGGALEEVRPLALPESGDRRTLIMVRKVIATPAQYPRRDGLPAKFPLCSEPA